MEEDKMLIVYTDSGRCGIYVNNQLAGSLPAGCDNIENLQNFATENLKLKNVRTICPGDIDDMICKKGWPEITVFLNEE